MNKHLLNVLQSWQKVLVAHTGFDCGWSATTETEEELMAKAAEHVKESQRYTSDS